MKYKCPHCNKEFEAKEERYSSPSINKCPLCHKEIEWETGFSGDEDGWYCFSIKPWNVK